MVGVGVGTGGSAASGGGGVPATSTGGTAAKTGGTGGMPSTGGTSATTGGAAAAPGGAPSGTGGTQSAPPPGGGGGMPAGGGGGAGGTTPGTGGSSGAAPTGGTGGSTHVRDHCIDGYAPLPIDDTMKDGPVSFEKGGQVDTTVQPEVIAWMKANSWQEAHFQWHNIRRCNGGFGKAEFRIINPCDYPELVPADQEGQGPGDGLQFLAMHRHMIQALKQLFPKHTEQFEGWEHPPQSAEDLPEQWRQSWTPFSGQVWDNMQKADDPASHMNEKGFESEGDFGQWIQTTSQIHGALHFKWVRSMNQDHGLGNQYANIDNYMFWKMHGWIDKVWDRYRAAKGKTPNDADIKEAVLKQCREMDVLAQLIDPSLNPNPMPEPGECTPAPKQTGFFVDKIRPIFESETNKCTGCHGSEGANASLTLGGSDCVKSSDIVAALVDKPSTNGGQFKLIVPGKPEESWLYLKVANEAATAGCTPTNGVQCNPLLMPQGSTEVTLTQQELADLRQWIMDGAPAPQ